MILMFALKFETKPKGLSKASYVSMFMSLKHALTNLSKTYKNID